MTVRKVGAVLAVTCASALAAPVVAGAATHSTAARPAAATTQASSFKNIPVTGTAKNGKKFTGHFTVSQFATRGGKTVALGTLTGRLGNRSIKPTQVAIPASVAQAPAGAMRAHLSATCPVLHLNLGPLNLNLLGLHVDLNQVILNITAVSGAGNLLGNLLCGVSNLLNTTPVGGTQLSGLLGIVQQLVGSPGLLGL
jgi:hypothetical protein